jgi:hypothetical protein
VFLDKIVQLAFILDRNTLRVQLARQHRRVPAAVDIGNLGGGESYDLDKVVVAVERIEIMEIAARRAHDNHFLSGLGHVILTILISCLSF